MIGEGEEENGRREEPARRRRSISGAEWDLRAWDEEIEIMDSMGSLTNGWSLLGWALSFGPNLMKITTLY